MAATLAGHLDVPTCYRSRCPGPYGGGIRGLSETTILHGMIARLRIDLNQEVLRPYEYFDMICGTSTGGYASDLVQ